MATHEIPVLGTEIDTEDFRDTGGNVTATTVLLGVGGIMVLIAYAGVKAVNQRFGITEEGSNGGVEGV